MHGYTGKYCQKTGRCNIGRHVVRTILEDVYVPVIAKFDKVLDDAYFLYDQYNFGSGQLQATYTVMWVFLHVLTYIYL